MKTLIGSHVGKNSLVKEIKKYDLGIVQLFISSPRSWAEPKLSPSQLKELKTISKTIPIYVHSPYLFNPASNNPEVRRKTLKSLKKQLKKVAEFGGAGVIVHAGQGGVDSSVEEAIQRWKETVADLHNKELLIIENTAGGTAAPGRNLEDFAKLLNSFEQPINYCIDTNHAWNGGFGLENLHSRLKQSIGYGPSLVHLNGTTDDLHSGRDRHSNLDLNEESTRLALEFIKQAKAPVILETPGENLGKDLEIVRRYLNE